MGRSKNLHPQRRVPLDDESGLDAESSDSCQAEHTSSSAAIAANRNDALLDLSIHQDSNKHKQRRKRKQHPINKTDGDDDHTIRDLLVEECSEVTITKSGNGTNALINIQAGIRHHGRNTDMSSWRCLRRRAVTDAQVYLVGQSSEEAANLKAYSLATASGTTALLQLVFGEENDMTPVGLAVEDGTVAVELDVNEILVPKIVSIHLTEKAFQVAAPSELFIATAKSRWSKSVCPAKHLQQALAALFPDTIVAHALLVNPSAPPITAKMVYDRVDNVQLKRYEDEDATSGGAEQSQDLSIKGLVPKLRPYQEAAVRWMLQRERGESLYDEWELAWVVLTENGSVLPLHGDSCKEDIVLFSPFAGWLVLSHAHARDATCGLSREVVKGGILADSMGLGKTVEVIACMLANRFVDERKIAHLVGDQFVNKKEENKALAQCIPAVASTPLTPTKAPIADTSSLMGFNRYGKCICGRDRTFIGSLSFVLCRLCRNPMHGICAGFMSMEQLVSETSLDHTTQMDQEESVRLCSDDWCPTCVVRRKSEGLLKSRATLIVAPPAILSQWEREFQRHTTMSTDNLQSRLKVVVYPGIRDMFRCRPGRLDNQLGRPHCHMVHPRILADADVVLTTFDALMGDLGHDSDENPYVSDGSVRLRARKRYRVIPSPLTGIKWWRICLDEAQRIEVPTATSARMALKLETEHRWCVSGTPIGRGKLEDLYGLLLFLRLVPFASKTWFHMCLQTGHEGTMERVERLLQHILWRSTKASDSVRVQMGIPSQVEKKVVLRFSSIERHFYDRQLERTMLAASDLIDANERSKKRKVHSHEMLSHHLHRLRAACCHPQVGSTGLGRSTKKCKQTSYVSSDGNTSPLTAGSGVLTMDQILDKLIDDTKQQCEEAQRLAIMHTNAMAALSRLKVEAKPHGGENCDKALLKMSCDLYMESLDLTERNSTPSSVIGEAVLTGCQGFLLPRTVVRDGKSLLQWKISVDSDHIVLRELWARYDFDGTSKKICQLKIQSLNVIPLDRVAAGYQILHPRECTLQVAHPSLGGEFVDVATFCLDNGPSCETTTTFGGFRTNKSKAWRVVVKSFHEHEPCCRSGEVLQFYVGLIVELFEPDIASDSIQRLHVLHNAAESMLLMEQHQASADVNCAPDAIMKSRIEGMQNECEKIESLYLDGARAIHAEVKNTLEQARDVRTNAFWELASACKKGTARIITDLWNDAWWEDVLSNCFLNGISNDSEQLCLRVQNDLDSFCQSQIGQEYQARNRSKTIPRFRSVNGLQTVLMLRVAELISEIGEMAHSRCMEKVTNLSAYPQQAEQLQNSHCHKCHVDWNQTGPECNHCKLETEILRIEPDAMILCILGSIWKWLKDSKSSGKTRSVRVAARVDERAEKFFDVVKASEKEWHQAKKAWRVHLDLLNDIDEVNQCKRSMRLAGENENLSVLSSDELNAVVMPPDIPVRLMDHSAKQAMALGNLRRHTQTLRYLKNQNEERRNELKKQECNDGKAMETTNCILCLSPMEEERAFLSCGHSFHEECIQPLIKQKTSLITCPLRCTIKSKKQDVMIASDRRKDDGSQRTRDVRGSWGTKVTRLLCDLVDVSDMGEKSIVFSQWDDMLWVVEEALIANNVGYVRVKSMKKVGEDIARFRSNECQVLLLNVKNGAEGLTLVEATHIFMVEPLLNCGLDSQAISRIHRIGQTRTTFIHRFLIEGTIEIKIDKLRMARQDDEIEDSIKKTRDKHDIEGGGIDGGFSHEELHELLKE